VSNPGVLGIHAGEDVKSQQSGRDWAPVLRWVFFLGGLGSSWYSMASGDMPFTMWLGLTGIILAGGLGLNLAIVGAGLGLFFLRYALFLAPLLMQFQQPWWVTGPLVLGFTLWESAPLWVAGAVGVWALRRRSVPTWAVFVLVAGIHLSLVGWLPRPYYFSWGASLLSRFPSGVWMFGVDLFAAITLGWICVVARTITQGHRTLERTITVAAAPFAVLAVCLLVHQQWESKCESAAKDTHSVITVQGAMPPFSGGFAVTSDRLLTPVVVYSSLRPDFLLFPECIAQVAGRLDGMDEKATAMRHVTAVTTAIAAPYSQVAFGVRDWNTNRTYFTDIVNGKPDVLWKDEEFRTPFVDQWPVKMTPLVARFGFHSEEQIMAPKRTASMGLFCADKDSPNGLKEISRGVVLMSGEIRRPAIVGRIRAEWTAKVLINPSIAGWLGGRELQGSILQANARAMELGMTLYRAGQLGGTGIYVPWQDVSMDDIVQSYGPGIGRYRARIPQGPRFATGYTSIFWAGVNFAPFAVLLTLAWLLIPEGIRSKARLPLAGPVPAGEPSHA